MAVVHEGSDRATEPVNQRGFGGLAIVLLPCIVTAEGEKKLLVFLKEQEAGDRGENGG